MPAVRHSPLPRLFWPVHPYAGRVSGNRLATRTGSINDRLLATVGRKSSLERISTLNYFRRNDRFVISNADCTRHPAWYFNLMANPEANIQACTSMFRIRTRESEGEKRARLWQQAVSRFKSYAEYQQRSQRRIPIAIVKPIVMPGPGD